MFSLFAQHIDFPLCLFQFIIQFLNHFCQSLYLLFFYHQQLLILPYQFLSFLLPTTTMITLYRLFLFLQLFLKLQSRVHIFHFSLYLIFLILLLFHQYQKLLQAKLYIQVNHRISYKIVMGQQLKGEVNMNEINDILKKDMIICCVYCKQEFNLVDRHPIMVCFNQHNYCEKCMQDVNKNKKCFECKEMLLLKKKKNQILIYMINKLNPIKSSKESQDLLKTTKKPFSKVNSLGKKDQSQQSPSKSISISPSKRSIKIKSVREPFPLDPNISLFEQHRQFRKQYSVASIFVHSQEQKEQKPKSKEQTIQQNLSKLVEDYQISFLRNMQKQKKNIEQVYNLDLHLNKLPKIFPVFSEFYNLQRLNLAKNNIKRIQNLSAFKHLTYLSLSDNQIQLIQGLEELLQLRNLYLNRNKIQKIQSLRHLINLQCLGIGNNYIKKIENIEALVKLRWLNLQENKISIIEGVITLQNLQILLLAHNEIVDFEGFDKLTHLQEINVQNNKIMNVKRALGLKHPKKIKLQNNPGLIQDNSQQYLQIMELIEAKSKGIETTSSDCNIY